jgi:hypothetical protein
MAQVTITIKTPASSTHPNVQVWDDIDDEPSMHLLGQTSLQQAKRIIIDSDSGSISLTPVAGKPNQYTLTLS